MGTPQSRADEIMELLESVGPMRAKRMFGEFGVYLGEKMVALICDGVFFVKDTPAGRALLQNCDMGAPYPRAKPHFAISDDLLENAGLMRDLLRRTAEALPVPKPKAKR